MARPTSASGERVINWQKIEVELVHQQRVDCDFGC
jgi:hypothetical protein